MTAQPPVSIGIIGSKGRMGEQVLNLLQSTYRSRASVGARIDVGDPLESLWSCDAVIDFSSADAMTALARQALSKQGRLPAFVVGSTGWNDERLEILGLLAQRARLLMSSNFSAGVAVLNRLLREASPLLAQLGYAPVIVETHHRHKKDAPSGTALLLKKTIEATDPAVRCQVHSVRAGEVIGDHEVTFFGVADRLILGHYAQDRSVLARGAIESALWLAGGSGEEKARSGKILTIDDYLNTALKAVAKIQANSVH